MAAKNEWVDKDYYADLGVTSSASDADIKKAYRKLARENHPDSHPGDAIREEKFKKVAEAYDVVGDPTRRKEYDEFKEMLRVGGGFRGGGQSFQDFSDIFGGGRSTGGFSDIFGGSWGATRRSARPTRGSDVETEITLDFREAAKGTTLPVQLTGDAPCAACHGSGSRTGATSACKIATAPDTSPKTGRLRVLGTLPRLRWYRQSHYRPLSGLPRHWHGTTLSIHHRAHPRGVVDGQKVRLAGQGEAGPHGTPAGDLFVTVHVRPDKVFTRDGDNLEVEVPVSFGELALGGTVSVPTLEKPVRVRIPAGTPDGRVLRVRGRGVPKRDGSFGDLYVKVKIRVPKDLTDDAKDALHNYMEAEKHMGFDPRATWAGNES